MLNINHHPSPTTHHVTQPGNFKHPHRPSQDQPASAAALRLAQQRTRPKPAYAQRLGAGHGATYTPPSSFIGERGHTPWQGQLDLLRRPRQHNRQIPHRSRRREPRHSGAQGPMAHLGVPRKRNGHHGREGWSVGSVG